MRNRSKTKRQRDKKVIEASKYKVQKESTFMGLVLERTIEQNKSNKTQLRSFPASVVVGFSNNKKLAMIEYDFSTVHDKDVDYISGFFSQMKEGDTFSIVKGTSEWTDGIQKKKDLLAGNYIFKKNLSEGIYIVEADFDFDGSLYQKSLKGRFFIRPLQFEKAGSLKAKRTLARITNFLSNPSLTSLGIIEGSQIELENTNFNDGIYTVMKINTDSVDMESITVSPPIKQNEDRLGERTKIKSVIRSTSTKTSTIGKGGTRDTGTPPDSPGRGRGINGSGTRAEVTPSSEPTVTESNQTTPTTSTYVTPNVPSTPSTPARSSTPRSSGGGSSRSSGGSSYSGY